MPEIWDLTISTPIGRQIAALRMEEADGELTGVAEGTHETVPMAGLRRQGDCMTWTQEITKPLKLSLAFDVTIDGDELTGTAKAGRLPSSKVRGRRRT